ncbi:DUF4148 domain-containing protein [Leptospira sp. SA-E8]|uniref:DUF4148 domain-containing protein n=1 Tax=Leptospira sp. SA-E8 TaxID=3422259 RepID=UPI003EBC6B24
MNRSTSLSIVAIAAALIAGPALADTPAKTGEQAKAELTAAVRNGDMTMGSEGKLSKQFPDLYPQQTAQTGKTRAQVKAELAEAVRTGDIVAAGSEDNQTLGQQFPGFYAQKAVRTNTAFSGNGAVTAN